MELIPELKPAPGNHVNIPQGVPIYVLCDNGKSLTLLKVNPLFYGRSEVCCKSTTVQSAEVLQKYNTKQYQLSEYNYVVSLTTYSAEDIVQDTVHNFTELYKLLHLNDALLLDIAGIQEHAAVGGFITDIARESRELWQKNKVLLYNTETKEYNRPHFNLPAGVAAPAYALPDSDYVKPYKIKPWNVEDSKDTLWNSDPMDINTIFEMMLDQQLLKLARRLALALLTSMKYCHIIISLPILDRLLRQFADLKYYMFYTWRILYLEEKSKYITATVPDRFIMSLDTLSRLPTFNFDYNSPYIPILAHGLCSLRGQPITPCLLPGARGFYNNEQFQNRFNIYTQGIFHGLNWNKTAVCGSIIPACAIRNPLEGNFGQFEDYIEEYYPSNPEYGPNKKVIHKSIDPVPEMFILEKDPEASEDDSDEEEQPQQYPTSYTDIDMMIETNHEEEFDRLAQQHFEVIQRNSTRRLEMHRVDTENRYKYKITGLPREIDIFMVSSIPGTIVKFHLGCVRAWYDGNGVLAFPSFVTAGMTGLNVDMRWVSCNKDLRDIVLKYYQRGFGFLCNYTDRLSLIAHMNASSAWPDVSAPPLRANRWAMYRYLSTPLLQDVASKLMNPSHEHIGIHYGLLTKGRCLRITIPYVEGSRRGRNKKGKCMFRSQQGACAPEFMKFAISNSK